MKTLRGCTYCAEEGCFINPFTLFLQSLLDKKCKVNYTLCKRSRNIFYGKKGWILKTYIRELRKGSRLSQEALAMAVGTTRQTITSIEIGKYTASLVLAYKIAHYFGRPIEEVFDFSDVNM